MKIVSVICFLLGALSLFRGVVEAKWASDHAGGVFAHRPFDVVWPIVMFVLFVFAGLRFWKRAGAIERKDGS